MDNELTTRDLSVIRTRTDRVADDFQALFGHIDFQRSWIDDLLAQIDDLSNDVTSAQERADELQQQLYDIGDAS